MRFERSVAHLLFGLIVAFSIVLISSLYWGVIGSDTALASPFNYRQRDALAALERGAIVDRHETPLVESLLAESGGWLRVTHDPSLPSITGYASLTYSTGGAEAAYNALLTGADQPVTFADQFDRDVLHRPQAGSDIQLTLDLAIQQAAAETLNGRTGAVIVMDATTGALLAVASSPSIDPATLDTDWESLIKRPDNPFFNRALQSEYQPGGALQPVLMAGWLIAARAPDEALTLSDSPAAPVTIGEATLTCLIPPLTVSLTAGGALFTGCPSGFVALIEALGETEIANIMTLFGATQHITLDGFTLPAPVESAPTTTSPDWQADALGQGVVRLSPLDMAVITAGIANDGNAPHPYLLHATRSPDSAEWVAYLPTPQTRPITTAQTAQALQTLLYENAESGTAAGAAHDDLIIGAHVAQAVSGEQNLLWFTGFVQLEQHHSLVTVILWEGENTPTDISQAGGALLRAAVTASENTVND